MEVIILFILILTEIGFFIFSLIKKSNISRQRSFVVILLMTVYLILILSPVIDWNLKWLLLGIFMGLQALIGIINIAKHKENSYIKPSKLILISLSRIFLIIVLMLPTIIFPQYDNIKPDGEYKTETISYTLTDESRKEYFTEEDDYRKVTIQFWYPSDKLENKELGAKEKFPLIVFSHGAFGFRMSNYSTFQELASNGYIVCSIDHTYHSFLTKQVNDKNIVGNMEFVKNAMDAQNGILDENVVYDLGVKWMELRTADMKFVLEYIENIARDESSNNIFANIDLNNIGVLGHSLGGATAAQIGRNIRDVDSVIVIDGTMLGEIIGFENGKEIISEVPYPKPILNIYSEAHYAEAFANQDNYANMVSTKNALNAYEVVINGAGHINFTDLPIVSPPLAKLLGIGEVEPKYCLETTNKLILEFFDTTLKSNHKEIARERVY